MGASRLFWVWLPPLVVAAPLVWELSVIAAAGQDVWYGWAVAVACMVGVLAAVIGVWVDSEPVEAS